MILANAFNRPVIMVEKADDCDTFHMLNNESRYAKKSYDL